MARLADRPQSGVHAAGIGPSAARWKIAGRDDSMTLLAATLALSALGAGPMEPVKVSADAKGFILAASGGPFTPWGAELLPWVRGWGHLSGFIPEEVAPDLDFVSVHIYPEKGKVDEALADLKWFAVGKPLVIEETFNLSCSRGGRGLPHSLPAGRVRLDGAL